MESWSLRECIWIGLAAGMSLQVWAAGEEAAASSEQIKKKEEKAMTEAKKPELAVFGQGCFWCAEAIYQRVPGVKKVESGYSGGKVEHPTYEQVCSGVSGHAEVIRIEFDPEKVSYEKLLDIFFTTHDPTTLNRQGNDSGTQYRSVVFYLSEAQKKAAGASKEKWDKSKHFKSPIVTEISAAGAFHKAEEYHQNYFNLNPEQGYCRAVIRPKVDKFEKEQAKKTEK